jgi:hypothetical protein
MILPREVKKKGSEILEPFFNLTQYFYFLVLILDTLY